MRLKISLEFKEKKIYKDFRVKFLSLFKKSLQLNSEELFQKYYKNSNEKLFTYSVNLGKLKFEKDFIEMDDNKGTLYFSTYDYEIAINFYNSFLKSLHKEFKFGDNYVYIRNISMVKERIFTENNVIFKLVSPLVIREHNKETNKDWYFTIDNSKGIEILKKNLKFNLPNIFGDKIVKDIDEMIIKPINFKKTVVLNKGQMIESSLGNVEVTASPYLLDYFYKAGLSTSKSSFGFNMVDVL